MRRVAWIVVGLILILVIGAAAIVGYFAYRYGHLGFYQSGGVLSTHQASYDVVHYDLAVRVIPEQKAIQGSALITLRIVSPISKVELDLLHQLKVTGADVDGETTTFEREADKLWVALPDLTDSLRQIHVTYEGQPLEALYPPWIGGFNWSKDADGYDWIGLSCQGEGAKVWFPCKDHPSDEPDSVTLRITVPRPAICVANGLQQSIDSTRAGWLTYVWKTHYPINNYDINFSIGHYQAEKRNYVAEDGTLMPVVFYYLRQSSPYAARHADMAVDMLKTYRKFFGEYPFVREKFGIVETDYLGMEHQTINAYGNHFNYTVIEGHVFDELMLHEMGHEWWGNKITVNDWADFWIHEGICTYGEALYHLDKTGEKGYHAYMATILKKITNKKPIVPKRPASSTDAYSSDIYTKGAYLMHSLRYILTDSVFFPFLKAFATDSLTTYQHRVSTEDFVNYLRPLTDSSVIQFVIRFLETTDIPTVRIDSIGQGQYAIAMVPFALPMDVVTNDGLQRVTLSAVPTRVHSTSMPHVDPQDWYYKSVVYFPAGE